MIAGKPVLGRHHLFIDDFMIEEMDGVKRVLNQPTRFEGNPVITAQEPCELTNVSMPRAVFDDQAGLFRMLYRASGPLTEGQAIGDQTRVANVCYAESEDGFSWRKPSLGVREWVDGKSDNNIVIRSFLGIRGNAVVSAFAYDPADPDPDRRFKIHFKDQSGGREIWNYSFCSAFSPDGIHWREMLVEPYVIDHCRQPDELNLDARYVRYGQANSFRGIREVCRQESKDFVSWSGGLNVIGRDLADPPGDQFYGMSVDPVNSRTTAGLRIGMLQVYHSPPYGPDRLERYKTFPDMVDAHLAVSRDSIRWQRPCDREPFLRCGPEGSWDAGMIYAGYPLVKDDTIYIFYSGHRYRHAGGPEGTEEECGIGVATMRRDGYVSVEPVGKDDGRLLTASFFPIPSSEAFYLWEEQYCVETRAIAVNADATRGELRVEIVTHQGDVVPGYSAADCDPIREDVMAHRVTWKGESDLGKIIDLKVPAGTGINRRFRLRFHLASGTKLYGFELLAPPR